MSTESIYILNGTIGQPDTQLMTGGSTQLSGGFWNNILPSSPPTETGENIFLPLIIT